LLPPKLASVPATGMQQPAAASAGSVAATCADLHGQLREAATALRLSSGGGGGGGVEDAGAINPWYELDAQRQRQQFQTRLAALKQTLESYQARARAGDSVAIRRVLVANRDAEAAARRHRELQICIAECKRLAQRHIAARRGGASPAATPFGSDSSGSTAPVLAQLEAAAADLGLDTYLDVSGATTATMTLSSEAILVDVAMTKNAGEDVHVDGVTVQLMHAQRGLPHVWEEAGPLAKRDWIAFHRRLTLIVQTAALAAVPVQPTGAGANAKGGGVATAAQCLEAVEADVRELVASERQLEASSKTSATTRLLHGSGLLENESPADGSAATDTGAGPTLRALWVYAEPAAFSLAMEKRETRPPAKGKKAATPPDDDSQSLRLASSARQFGVVRMVFALERGGGSAGDSAGLMQAGSWIKKISAAKYSTSGEVVSVEFLADGTRPTAAETGETNTDAAFPPPKVTVSAQLLEPLVVAPRTLAALQALGATADGDGKAQGQAAEAMDTEPPHGNRGEKRKRCDSRSDQVSTGADAGRSASLSDMVLPPRPPLAAASVSTASDGSAQSELSSQRHWDVSWHSPSDASSGGSDGGGGGGGGSYRLQRFVSSSARGSESLTCGLRISRLLCCANVQAWQETVGLLRQQATWNTLYSSCFRPVTADSSTLGGAKEDTTAGGPSDAVVFEVLSADSSSPESLSLRFVHRTGGDVGSTDAGATKGKGRAKGGAKKKKKLSELEPNPELETGRLQMLLLTLRVGIGGDIEPALSSSATVDGGSGGGEEEGSAAASSSSLSLEAELETMRTRLADLLTRTHQLPVALAMAGIGCASMCFTHRCSHVPPVPAPFVRRQRASSIS
jgi:hypothetical protein